MSERLNVLSIDWDYFIDASASDRLMLFPDGGNENLSNSIQDIIWMGRYNNEDLAAVKSDSTAVRLVKSILKKTDARYMIVDSHKYAYDFIVDNMNEYCKDSLNLVNIDFHHDVYENGSDVDCGNWLAKIIEIYKEGSSFTWVGREDSDVSYRDDIGLEFTTSLEVVSEYAWDIVFICRSGMWSPPHLDERFRSMFNWITKCYTTKYQKDIFTDRYRRVKKMCGEYGVKSVLRHQDW